MQETLIFGGRHMIPCKFPTSPLRFNMQRIWDAMLSAAQWSRYKPIYQFNRRSDPENGDFTSVFGVLHPELNGPTNWIDPIRNQDFVMECVLLCRVESLERGDCYRIVLDTENQQFGLAVACLDNFSIRSYQITVHSLTWMWCPSL